MQLTLEEKQERALTADELLVEFCDKEESVAPIKLGSVWCWDNRPKLRSHAQGQGGLLGSVTRAKKALEEGLVTV